MDLLLQIILMQNVFIKRGCKIVLFAYYQKVLSLARSLQLRSRIRKVYKNVEIPLANMQT